jgi:hypothetical protein
MASLISDGKTVSRIIENLPNAEAVKVIKSWKPVIREIYEEYKDALEEAGLLREFIGVLDYVDSTLVVAKRYRPPPVIARTLAYDGLRILDDFAREYRGYVRKVMDHVCMELRSLLYEAFEGE